MPRWGLVVGAYLLMAGGAIGSAVAWLGVGPWEFVDAWLPLPPAQAHAYSLALGVACGLATVAASRWALPRFGWARALHEELRPFVHGLPLTGVLALALASALGEELLFRGVLLSWWGLVPQALVFGLVHQVRGRGRWAWVAWAALMGLLLGVIVRLTGSLLGAIAAHALVNAVNLRWLQRREPAPARRLVGGLLGRA